MSGNHGMHARSVYTTATATATAIEVYEYITPGTYFMPVLEPVTATSARAPSPYLQDYLFMPWCVSPPNPATYVVSPIGVVNYLSDLQQHMSLPAEGSLSSGMIYGILNTQAINTTGNEDEGSTIDVILQDGAVSYREEYPLSTADSPNSDQFEIVEMPFEYETQDDEGASANADEYTDEGVSQPDRQRIISAAARQEACSSENNVPCRQSTSKVVGEFGTTVNRSPRKRRQRKHVYRAEQGYLVEEPSDTEDSPVSIEHHKE